MNITTANKLPLPDPPTWMALTKAPYLTLAVLGITFCYFLFEYLSKQTTEILTQIESLKGDLSNSQGVNKGKKTGLHEQNEDMRTELANVKK